MALSNMAVFHKIAKMTVNFQKMPFLSLVLLETLCHHYFEPAEYETALRLVSRK